MLLVLFKPQFRTCQKNSHHPGKDGDSLKKIGLWILSRSPENIHVKVYDNAHPCREQEHLKIRVKMLMKVDVTKIM